MLDDWEYLHNYLPSVVATSEKRTHRIEICKSCEEITELKFCNKCNCFMPAKTWVDSRTCPMEKW
jgi:hypothetical protein